MEIRIENEMQPGRSIGIWKDKERSRNHLLLAVLKTQLQAPIGL